MYMYISDRHIIGMNIATVSIDSHFNLFIVNFSYLRFQVYAENQYHVIHIINII